MRGNLRLKMRVSMKEYMEVFKRHVDAVLVQGYGF